MDNITVGWMYPDILNLHGERSSVQALVSIGSNLGLEIEIRRIDDFEDPIPYQELDMLMFLPGEISSFRYLVPALRRQMKELTAYVENGGHILALGTSGLLFGNKILREDGSVQEGLGIMDLTATERKYVWGDDLHFRIKETRQELIGSQIMMLDVETATPLGTTIYGRGNNGTGTEGARYQNLIYTNCCGPLFVKNPWFAEDILKDIALSKYLGLRKTRLNRLASDSFDSTERFLKTKRQQYSP